jgi:hypothetical protein
MDYSKQISTSMWLMIAIQTISSIDLPGQGKRKLPAPRNYIAIIIAWSILHTMDDADMGRAGAIMGWIFLLTGMVIGPFGTTATNFLESVAKNYAIQPPSHLRAVSSPGWSTYYAATAPTAASVPPGTRIRVQPAQPATSSSSASGTSSTSGGSPSITLGPITLSPSQLGIGPIHIPLPF